MLSAVEDDNGLVYTGTDTTNGYGVKGLIYFGNVDTPNDVVPCAYENYAYELVM